MAFIVIYRLRCFILYYNIYNILDYHLNYYLDHNYYLPTRVQNEICVKNKR